jgi:glycosyltransferase involved in cell wall biosynthesis
MPDAPAQNPPASQEDPADIEPVPVQLVRVGWIAGRETHHRLGRTLQPLAIGLMDELVQLNVFCPLGHELGPLPTPPVEVVPFQEPRWWQFRTRLMEDLIQEVRRRDIHVLHGLDATTMHLTRRIGRETDTPYVLSAYERGAFGHVGRLGSLAQAVHATSEFVREDVLNRHLVRPQKVHLIRPGVYPVRHPTCFDEPEQKPAIVAGGNLSRVEPYEAVLTAFAKLRDAGRECVFFLVGSGPAEKPLRKIAEDLDLHSDLTFCDPLSATQMGGILKAADVYVSPAPLEVLDMQSLVAMAAGVPVVSATGGVSDFLIDGETALTFPAGNTTRLLEKLDSLLDDHSFARGLCKQALRYIRENHSPANMVTAMACVYRGLTAEVEA